MNDNANLLKKYNDFLIQYVIKKYNLKSYDNELEKIGLIKDLEYNEYMKKASKYLNYLFIRNNIYIQNLGSDEINELNSYNEFNEKTYNFIEKTYLNVIKKNSESKGMVFYGNLVKKNAADVNQIVIGAYYNHNSNKKSEFDNIINKLSNESGKEVKVICYSDLETIYEVKI